MDHESISVAAIDKTKPISEEQKRIIAELYRTHEGVELAEDWSGLTEWDGYLFILMLEDKFQTKACA